MEYIFDLVILTGIQLLSMFGIFFLFGLLIYYIEKQTVKYIYSSLGSQGFLLTAWIGTPIHEFGHYVMCKIFRHNVSDVQWFPTSLHSHTLGYVRHSYDEDSLYQRIGLFFISIAPLMSGMVVLSFFVYLLLPSTYVELSNYLSAIQANGITTTNLEFMFTSSIEVLKTLFSIENIQTLQFWIFIVIAMGICTHMSLSSSDLRGVGRGFVTIAGFLFIVNFITILLGLDVNKWVVKIFQFNTYILGMMIFVLCLSLLTLLISWILYQFKKVNNGLNRTTRTATTTTERSTSTYRYKKEDLHNNGRS